MEERKFTSIKILMLTSSYPVAESYIGTSIQNISSAIIKNGIDVYVLIFSKSKKFSLYEDKYGIKIIEYPYSWFLPPLLHEGRGILPSIKCNLFSIFELPFYFFSTLVLLHKYAKIYDIIHANWLIPSGFIALVCRFFSKKPIVVTARGAEFHLPNTFLIRFILNLVLRGADYCTTVSNYMRRRAREYGLDNEKIKVINNAVDPSKFNVKRPKKKKVIIGTVRRLVPEKRIEDLLKAFNNLPFNLKEKCEIWVVGDGPDKSRLEKMAEELKISKFTKFFGMAPYDDVPKLLSKMDICINTSIQEGMANINLESMAAGCCTIATKGYGNDEVIKNGENGFLYEPKNVNQLSLLLKECIQNFPYHIGPNAKRRIKKDFSIDRIANEYIEIYEKLIRKK